MEETEEHITDMHDDMVPAVIRPPEMRSIENPDEIDYRKPDVYLSAKIVWIVFTGVKGGFPEEYRHSEKGIYLDKKKLQVETAEPLHAMLESATRYFWWERIDISTCVRHIDDQLDVRNIYRSRRKIIVEIEKISVGRDLSCIMETKIIANQPNDVPMYKFE